MIYSENEESFFAYKKYFRINNKVIDIKKKFNKGKFLICQSSSIRNRENVSDILDEKITIFTKELKINSYSEYFHKDLIGCSVINLEAEKIGNVIAVHNFGAGDLLELDNNYPYMIRFGDIKEENINITDKIMIIDLKSKTNK